MYQFIPILVNKLKNFDIKEEGNKLPEIMFEYRGEIENFYNNMNKLTIRDQVDYLYDLFDEENNITINPYKFLKNDIVLEIIKDDKHNYLFIQDNGIIRIN